MMNKEISQRKWNKELNPKKMHKNREKKIHKITDKRHQRKTSLYVVLCIVYFIREKKIGIKRLAAVTPAVCLYAFTLLLFVHLSFLLVYFCAKPVSCYTAS